MTKLSRVDRDALVMAMEQARCDPLRAQQLDAKLEDETWAAVARFAAACCQERALALPPWQPAPCDIPNIEAALQETDEKRGYRAAALLLQRMLAAGVSRWHPDPLRGLDEAETKNTI